jgi:spore germination cell wall hydrolase CwlJ-like protein
MKRIGMDAVGRWAIITAFLGGGAFINQQYHEWKADNATINARMASLEADQRANTAQIHAIAEATATELHDIKAILTQDSKKVKYTAKEVQCMAKNIYHEAGVETLKGKIAVGQVTLNRLATKRWGESICDVVYAKAQFSWTLDKKKVHEKPEGQLWEESKRAAYRVLKGERIKSLTASLYYHTDYIAKPDWVVPSARLAQIDQHIFYQKAKFVLIKKCEASKAKKCATHERSLQRA